MLCGGQDSLEIAMQTRGSNAEREPMNFYQTSQIDIIIYLFGGALQIIKGVDRGNVVDVICSRFQKSICVL